MVQGDSYEFLPYKKFVHLSFKHKLETTLISTIPHNNWHKDLDLSWDSNFYCALKCRNIVLLHLY